jgi:hypothetical protein
MQQKKQWPEKRNDALPIKELTSTAHAVDFLLSERRKTGRNTVFYFFNTVAFASEKIIFSFTQQTRTEFVF